jgi:hypothetical protein
MTDSGVKHTKPLLFLYKLKVIYLIIICIYNENVSFL